MTAEPHDAAHQVVADAFARRAGPLSVLSHQATGIAAAGRDLAVRFAGGGRLLAFGSRTTESDAHHVAVEFVHPVIVGKASLPAVALRADGTEPAAGALAVLARPGDIALAVCSAAPTADVAAGLRVAQQAGLLTVALVGSAGHDLGELVDHTITVDSDDALIVKEGHVTAYHLLWELAHLFLEATAGQPGGATPSLTSLYPSLYGGGDDDALMSAATSSAQFKVAEVATLRSTLAASYGQDLARAARKLADAFGAGATLLTFGNGGSSTDDQEVCRVFRSPPYGRPLPAVSLTDDVAVLTALANDVGFDVVFSRQLRALGRPGDIALALSTSGGSRNVLAGLEEASRIGMVTVGLSGYGGGPMSELPALQHLFAVPSSSVHRVQEVQTTIYHVLWEATQALLSGSPAQLRRQPDQG